MTVRLNRHLATCGVTSRRGADEMIAAGRVAVNGTVVKEMGHQVDPENDRVAVDGKLVRPYIEPAVVMLNKPRGVLTTMRDPGGRKTVADLVKVKGHRVVPVGRLDVQTTGLLLLTDDGDLANRLTHPRWGVEKEYLATIRGRLRRETRERLLKGVDIGDERQASFARLAPAHGAGPPAEGRTRWRCIVHEGRNHVVRRLFEAVEQPVHQLHRSRVGPLTMGQLRRGTWRRLTAEELAALREAAGLATPEP